MRQQTLALATLALALGFAPAARADLDVVASLPDLAAIAKEVGGDHAEVSALASPRQDPHYVDPRPSYLVKLRDADLVIANGLDLEASWLEPMLVQARNSDIQTGNKGYFNASTAVKLLQVPQQRITRNMGDIHPGGNPHFTFDPRAAAQLAPALAERMAALDPENTAAYRKNAKAFAARMNKLAEEQRARFAKLSAKQRRAVSYHMSLNYLWDWLDVKELTNVEPRPGIPPDPAHVAQVLKLMKAQDIDFIVQEEFYPTNVSQTLMKLTGNEKGIVLLEGGTRFAEGQTYEQHIRNNADKLYEAFSRQAR